MKSDSKFELGQQYFHINNNQIVTVVESKIIDRYGRLAVRVRAKDGRGYNAYIDLLRPLTKLELALK